MWVQGPVRCDLALEPELFRVRRKQQLDRGGVEANAMVQPLDPVFRVDALDGHHGCQDLRFRDAGRVASEQRFNIEGPRRRDYEVNPIAGDVHPRKLINDLVDLCDDNSALERSRFDHGWRILRVRAHVQIARTVGAASNGQGDVRSKVDEIACEQLDIGVDRAEFDLSRLQDPRYRVALRSGEGKIELLCDAFLEEVDVLGQHDAGLNDVQIVQYFGIGSGETRREKVRLLLVVAFEADAISGPDYSLQQRGRIVWRDHLSRCEFAPRCETFIAGSPLTLPISHVVQLLLRVPSSLPK